ELAQHLAEVAGRPLERVALRAGAAATSPGDSDIHHRPSFMPPNETTLERFVRERRLARSEGELAVHRKEDEVRMEDAS
ncbi:MAG: hypothetical protein JWP22_1492, partial [Ramlibacter sp.]|nr:hypothetical protein [Ramlibacter sp.]